MRLATILVYIFFISTTGQTAQAAVSDDMLYDEINRLYRWNQPEIFNNDFRDTQQTAIDSQSVTPDSRLFDDCLFNARPETALIAHIPGRTKRIDYFDDGLIQLVSAGYYSKSAGAELSTLDRGRDAESADSPNPSYHYVDEAVSWIKEVYHAWVPKNHYGSTRLLLLSFGLVGLIGIRRKFKKN